MKFRSPQTFLAGTAMLGALFSAPITSAQDRPAFPSDAQLRASYALPSSHFVTLEGEPVHYVDEGKGPAILLLHGSFASLRQWDDWAARLATKYRVIRYDKAPAGLSGPNPEGDYTVEHEIRVIDALMDRLGIGRFVIIGTSSAGVPAAAYAATRGDRLNGVVLANIADGPIHLDVAALPNDLKAVLADEARHPAWHGPEYWRQILLANVVDRTKVTPELVTRWTGLNNRMMRDPAIARQVVAASNLARTPGDLAKITVPTMLLWSDQDHETSLEKHGIAAFNDLGTKDKALEVIPDCGHMMPLDCPVRSLDRILPFLARVSQP